MVQTNHPLGSVALCAALSFGCTAPKTQAGDGATVTLAPGSSAAPAATATAPATATATATAKATAAPSTTPTGASSACAACDAKAHMMCSEQTGGECIDACLQGWAKVGMTHCGKICSKDADCAPDKGSCKPDMASNPGTKICDEKWMGLGNHVAP
ncbi:MAG: hypothetical protein HY908_03995 [Myxococcales bacterium]|nr:hypothetical protein [Myxococcales bacterium]